MFWAIVAILCVLLGLAWFLDIPFYWDVYKGGYDYATDERLRKGGDPSRVRLLHEDPFIPMELTRHLTSFPPDTFFKCGSVPSRIMSLMPDGCAARSVFLTNLEDRGKDNRMKAEYMMAMTPAYLDLYRQRIRQELESMGGITVADMVKRITVVLHFGLNAQEKDYSLMNEFIRAVSNPLDIGAGWSFRQSKGRHVAHLRERIQNATPSSIVGAWKRSTRMSEADMALEIAHNLIAMTIQWTAAARAAIMERPEPGDLSAFFSRHAFAPFIASRHREGHRVIAKTRRDDCGPTVASVPVRACPYSSELYETQEGELVPVGHTINTSPNFLAFGKGYRRCAGELLTHIFIQEVLRVADQLVIEDYHGPWGFGTL